MLKLIWLSAILALSATAEEPARDVTYLSMNVDTGRPLPTFDKGYLLHIKTHIHGLTVWDPERRRMYDVDIATPNRTLPSVYHAAVDTDGVVAVAVAYREEGVIKGGIAMFARDGTQTRFVETGRWVPYALCFSKGHSIWATGLPRGPVRNGEDRAGGFLVRRYSLDGKPTGEFLPRSLFSGDLVPGAIGFSSMRASNDRIGTIVYPGSGTALGHPEWVELDLDGKLFGTWKIGFVTVLDGGLAFTSDGRLWMADFSADPTMRN
jgi:hypothetical protein